MTGRTLDKSADAGQRRRERDRRARENLQDWYVRKLLTKSLDIPTCELSEALILAKRLQLLNQRMSQGRAADCVVDAVLAFHRAKYAAYMDDPQELSDPT
jgi:hypothetical protein